MNARSIPACGVFVALLALTPPCHPEDRPPITVVAGARATLAHRLSKELEAAGLQVQVEANDAVSTPHTIVIVIPEGDSGPIEIWSKSQAGSSLVASVGPEGTLDTRVLRAAELIRAFTAATHTSSPQAVAAPAQSPPAPITPPGPALHEKQQISPSRIAVPAPLLALPALKPALFDAGIALGLGAQPQGISMVLDASFRIWPHPRVGAGLFAELPILGAEIETPQGRASLRPGFVGAELVTAPLARTGRFGLILSPGVAFSYVNASGDANRPYHDNDVYAFAATLYGRAEARLRLFESLYLTAGGFGGAVVPPVNIRFAGQVVSTFRAHASFSLGILIQR